MSRRVVNVTCADLVGFTLILHCCEDLSGGNCYAWTLYSRSASVY